MKSGIRVGLAAVLAMCVAQAARASDWVVPHTAVVANPDWNITLTDAGYSDWCYDNTPGFEGREYLSGEWGAAVGYKIGGSTVSPNWLEKDFSFPNWTTNSTFSVADPIHVTGTGLGGNDVAARSTLTNGDLTVDMTYQMVDTVTGVQMGTSPASAAAGSSIQSNRYVLQQTYTFTNSTTTGQGITELNLFQFLHSLNGNAAMYDNRAYAGTMSANRYDTTLVGVDFTYSGTSSTSATLKDYIGFSSKAAPVAYDSGRYGINDGISGDDHAMGKPSVGIHYNVEGDSLGNHDSFSDSAVPLWVAGAQKYALGNLAPGESVSFDVILSLKTGTVVTPPVGGGGCSGIANGGSGHVGGVDFWFSDVTDSGGFFAEYDPVDANELDLRVGEGEFGIPSFVVPGTFQLFDLGYEGNFSGDVTLKLAYDPNLLPVGFDEVTLGVYHYVHGHWVAIGGDVDAGSHTITVTTDSFSPFAIGVAVPEPASLTVLAAGVLVLLRRRAS